ncbi:MAG TPA: hypothetical protein VNW99_14155, partial [Cytophagaceae bacterium]|nr:hypothetical protein [Cytophagaceae bacterium]
MSISQRLNLDPSRVRRPGDVQQNVNQVPTPPKVPNLSQNGIEGGGPPQIQPEIGVPHQNSNRPLENNNPEKRSIAERLNLDPSRVRKSNTLTQNPISYGISQTGANVIPSALRAMKYERENIGPIAKNIATSAMGFIPDLVGTILNLTGLPEHALGRNIPNLTHELNKVIDKYGGEVTRDKDAYITEMSKFMGSIFGTGGYGAGIKALGKAASSSKLEKVGEVLGKFGETKPTGVGIGASVAGGEIAAASHEAKLPWQAELPLVLLAAIAGGKVGHFTEKNIQRLLDSKLGHYQALANKIKPEDMERVIADAIENDEIDFLKRETLDSLSPAIRSKLENKKPFDLTDEELKQVVDKGSKNYTDFWNKIENEKGIFNTLGEHAGSPELSTFEKGLA